MVDCDVGRGGGGGNGQIVRMSVTCGDFLSFDIESRQQAQSTMSSSAPALSSACKFGFYTGKSCLFPSAPATLLRILQNKKLCLALGSRKPELDRVPATVLATATVSWPPEFVHVAEESERSGHEASPAKLIDRFDMFDETEQRKLGYANVYLCLHCFGHHIHVDFHVSHMDIDDQVKNKLLKLDVKESKGQENGEEQATPKEWLPLFQATHKERFSRMDPELRIFAEIAGISLPDTPRFVAELTPDYINSNLCGKKVCPAAAKFKEFGLGPLALTHPSGGGLGTLYSGGGGGARTAASVRPHGVYGLSQTYGNLDYYGAFGLLRKRRSTEPNTCGGQACPYVSASLPPPPPPPPPPAMAKQSARPPAPKAKRTPVCSKCKWRSDVAGVRLSAGADRESSVNVGIGTARPDYIERACPVVGYSLRSSTVRPPQLDGMRGYCIDGRGGGGGGGGGTGTGHQSYSIDASSALSLSGVTDLYQLRRSRYMSESMNNYCDAASSSFSLHIKDARTPANKQFEQPLFAAATTTTVASAASVGSAAAGCGALPSELALYAQLACNRDTCDSFRYETTCSECGGVSRSGATCDNKSVMGLLTPINSVSHANVPAASAGPASVVAAATWAVGPSASAKPVVVVVPTGAKETAADRRDVKQVQEEKNGTKDDVKLNVPPPALKRRTTTTTSRFVYHAGEYYSGIRVGHKLCSGSGGRNVPWDMGWLWNIDVPGLKRRRGWRPGVLSKIINDRIIGRRQELGIPNPPELKMLVRKTKMLRHREDDDEMEEEVEPKPTLVIQKKAGGSYIVTMHPLKDPKTVEDNENPYMDCSPMQFFISKPRRRRRRRARSGPAALADADADADADNDVKRGEGGGGGCACDDEPCAEDEEKEEEAGDDCDSSDSSELNIEFTTPAGLIQPERMKRRPNEVYVESQFHEDDYNCPSCSIIIPKYQRAKKSVRLKTK